MRCVSDIGRYAVHQLRRSGIAPPLTREMAKVCPVGPGGVALTPPAASYITGATLDVAGGLNRAW